MTTPDETPRRAPGRPRLPDDARKERGLDVRMSDTLRGAVNRAAKAAGLKPSEWARRVLESAAAPYLPR